MILSNFPRIGGGIPRTGQDIAVPEDPAFKSLRGRWRRRTGKPFGVPGGRVVDQPELGDLADTIGGGSEVLGPDQVPGYPGGAVEFRPPQPFPSGPPGHSQPSDFDQALAQAKLAYQQALQAAQATYQAATQDQNQTTAIDLAADSTFQSAQQAALGRAARRWY